MPTTETTSPASIPGFTHHTDDANGVPLHYVRGGPAGGEPVLLWHGFLGTWYVWRKVMPTLAEAGYAVLAPDMRGYGDSAKPPAAVGYDARTLVEDFRALIGQLGLGPVHLVAHDMGAPPALVWAGEHPDEVRTLTYLDEPLVTQETLKAVHQFTPEGTAHGGLWWWALAFADDLPERLLAGHEREFLEFSYRTYLYDRRSIEETAVVETLRTFAAPGGIAGAFGVYRAIFDTMRQTEACTKTALTLPVLALGGAQSLGERVRQMLAGVAPAVRGGSVGRCGHFIPEERPDELVDQLLTLFREGRAH